MIEANEGGVFRSDDEVFDFLSGQLAVQLEALAGIVARDVRDFNAALQEAGLQPVACT